MLQALRRYVRSIKQFWNLLLTSLFKMPILRIICWALIFVTRLRFPPGDSIPLFFKFCVTLTSIPLTYLWLVSALILFLPMCSGTLDGTFDIIINEAFHNTTLFHGFSASQFRKLLSLSVKNCRFLFNDCLYEQTVGVAMDLRSLFCWLILS